MAGSVARTLDTLEAEAEAGRGDGQQIAASIDLPLPTVYRLIRELLGGDYPVHLKEDRSFELYALGVSARTRLRFPRGARRDV